MLDWPDSGDDVHEIDPFSLKEGDNIYVRRWDDEVVLIEIGAKRSPRERRITVSFPDVTDLPGKLIVPGLVQVGANYAFHLGTEHSMTEHSAVLGIKAIRIVRIPIPTWPEVGEDVASIDPFELPIGYRIYLRVKHLEGVSFLRMGDHTDVGKRMATICDSDGRHEVVLARAFGNIKLGWQYYYQPGPDAMAHCFDRLEAIKVVRLDQLT